MSPYNTFHTHFTDPLAAPIIEAAGTDITHWFDKETRDPRTYVSPGIRIVWQTSAQVLNVIIEITMLKHKHRYSQLCNTDLIVYTCRFFSATNLVEAYCPQGRFLHVPPERPEPGFDTRIRSTNSRNS